MLLAHDFVRRVVDDLLQDIFLLFERPQRLSDDTYPRMTLPLCLAGPDFLLGLSSGYEF
jgi:hypothetical protein